MNSIVARRGRRDTKPLDAGIIRGALAASAQWTTRSLHSADLGGASTRPNAVKHYENALFASRKHQNIAAARAAHDLTTIISALFDSEHLTQTYHNEWIGASTSHQL